MKCFVCLEGPHDDDALRSGICLCKTSAVHRLCQLRLAQSRADPVPTCPVCLTPYTNYTPTRAVRPSLHGVIIVALLITGTVSVAMGAVLLWGASVCGVPLLYFGLVVWGISQS